MGYTHYWHRPQTIPDDQFQAIRSDFEKLILPLSDAGVELAGGLGEGPPTITSELICFNGLDECGHTRNEDVSIPYPSADAQGVGPSSTAIDGSFYNLGVTLKHRCCNGRCSFETFTLRKSRDLDSGDEPDSNGLYGEYVKTGFRPYDIAVTAALLIAKRHLGDQFTVHSDGADAQWSDARRICQRVLGYGDWFGIMEEQLEEDWPGPGGVSAKRKVILRLLVEIKPPKLG